MSQDGIELTGRDRLAALYNWKRGEAPSQVCFLHSPGEPVPSAEAVDWTAFPLTEGMEAALEHEVERLRRLRESIRAGKS